MSPSAPRSLGCVVLAGGRGARLGRDKAGFLFEGSPLLARVVANVSGACAPIVVAVREGQNLERPSTPLTFVRDALTDRGPLAGIAVGLEALARDVDCAFVVATDMPFTSPPFIRALAAQLREHDAVCVVRGGVTQPIGAVYRTRIGRVASRFLATSAGGPMKLLEAIDAHRVDEDALWLDASLLADDPQRRALEDIDTEADVARLSRR